MDSPSDKVEIHEHIVYEIRHIKELCPEHHSSHKANR